MVDVVIIIYVCIKAESSSLRAKCCQSSKKGENVSEVFDDTKCKKTNIKKYIRRQIKFNLNVKGDSLSLFVWFDFKRDMLFKNSNQFKNQKPEKEVFELVINYQYIVINYQKVEKEILN